MKGVTKMNYTIKRYPYPNYSVDVYLAYWYKLLYKIEPESGILTNDSVKKIPMSLTDIAIYLDTSVMTCKRFIKESVERGIITKDLVKVFKQRRNVFKVEVEYSVGILEQNIIIKI